MHCVWWGGRCRFSCKIAIKISPTVCNFQNFSGGMPPGLLAKTCFTCWLCFAQLVTKISRATYVLCNTTITI